jgi:hypothetical protein
LRTALPYSRPAKEVRNKFELRPNTVADYQIWNPPAEVQNKIRAHIENSHAARREAKPLLERAKRTVKIAIETDEPPTSNISARPAENCLLARQGTRALPRITGSPPAV